MILSSFYKMYQNQPTSMKIQKKSAALGLLGRFSRLSVILRLGVAVSFLFTLLFCPGVGMLAGLGVR
jgi:hypothetical protein